MPDDKRKIKVITKIYGECPDCSDEYKIEQGVTQGKIFKCEFCETEIMLPKIVIEKLGDEVEV